MKIDVHPPARPLAPRFSQASANQLEATFLAEMLKIAMPDPGSRGFGGGIGETQFGSFLTEQRATEMAARIDLGLTRRLGYDHA
ncbi:flagellar biosynthesis protein FlgJ [Paracoccus sanguinis]|uniref:flagellar biosynthesis protein FlgJ n=1 Tax=Paracoccus sanguinis TaxID=1545044 RepID=UPI001E55D773|nr:flagellar biosynthesis protein FlgJ [Paracoccus sanguinis]